MHSDKPGMTNRWLESRLKELTRNKSDLARAMGWANARVTALVQGKRQVKVQELPRLSRFLRMPTIEIVRLLNDGDVGLVGQDGEARDSGLRAEIIELDIPQNETFQKARRLIKAALEFKAEVSGKPLSSEMLQEHATVVTHAFIALGSGDDEVAKLDLDGALDTINAIKAITPKV